MASNDETLIGRSTDELFILRRIKEAPASDVLVHTNRTKDDWTQYFGLMERGRNVYVYVYSSERDVFDSTLQNVCYALIAYAVVLAVIQVIRWSDGAELPGKGVSRFRRSTRRNCAAPTKS